MTPLIALQSFYNEIRLRVLDAPKKVLRNAQDNDEATAIDSGAFEVGVHVLVDLHDCNRAKLDNEVVLTSLITQAATNAGATVLNRMSHKFQPQGVTAIVLLAESHLSIHTWPETGYAAVDILTCGSSMDPYKCIRTIAKALEPASFNEKTVRRHTKGGK